MSNDDDRIKELSRKKRELRSAIRSKLSEVTSDSNNEWSRRIATHVEKLQIWKQADTVLAFLSMPGEVTTDGIIQTAFDEGKLVGVPRMSGSAIHFHAVDSLDGPWEMHPYGVKEPLAECRIIDPTFNPEHKYLVITPGCAFDLNYGRIGYGKGYYDRFMHYCRQKAASGQSRILYVGVCFEKQIVDRVPMGDYDCRIDGLLTENGLRLPQSAQSLSFSSQNI